MAYALAEVRKNVARREAKRRAARVRAREQRMLWPSPAPVDPADPAETRRKLRNASFERFRATQLRRPAEAMHPLRARRLAAGMTLRELAGACPGRSKPHVNTVWATENGLSTPSAETLRRLAAALGCSPDDLTP